MEVDRILYIFGSFTRKKQDKRKSFEQSSISAGNSPLRGARRPVSQNLNIAPRTSAYGSGRKSVLKEWECAICKKELVEPRLLACLHSFCTRCLQGLHHEGETEAWSEVEAGSIRIDSGESASGGGSGGSGYESDIRRSGSEGSWEQKSQQYGIYTRKISGKSVQCILCPTCGYETPLPLGGISALPLNYVLLRKMMAAAKEADRASVLCDLCTSDNKAERRCNQCLVSVCTSCGEAHGRKKATARHSLHPLDPGPVKYCSQHQRAELTVYCATCQQVICRDCCVISHSGHALANASRAAAERARLLRDACERAKHVPENVDRAVRILNEQAYEDDSQASRVEAEVAAWASQYQRAVEAHVRALGAAAARARAQARRRAEARHRDLALKAQHSIEAVRFAEELLSSAKEDEVLSLSAPVLRRLELVTEVAEAGRAGAEACALRFAPLAPAPQDPTLFGRLLTRTPDPETCVLHTQGLQDLRVDCPHEATLELRDSSGQRIWCGGDQVCGYFRRRDSSARPQSAVVRDRMDGLYSLAFTAPAPGAYLLAVTVNNKPIKGSPFPCAARVAKSHTGTFHCCSFCSSGGKRDATCACGATMPGGYKGCGHGHAGWPGARHWSCCGAAHRLGPCTQPPAAAPAPSLYQFSL